MATDPPTCCGETLRPVNPSRVLTGTTRGDHRKTNTVFHLRGIMVCSPRPFHSLKYSNKPPFICHRFRVYCQEQVQPLRQPKLQVSAKSIGSSDGKRHDEQLLPCQHVLPCSWSFPRHFNNKTKSFLTCPVTPLPRLRQTLAPNLCIPNEPLLIPFHSDFPNQVLRCLLRSLSFTRQKCLPPRT